MATLIFNLVSMVCYVAFAARIIYGKCSAQHEDKFLKFQRMVEIQTFNEQRLADRNANAFHQDVYTNLQCLDICLRTEKCASVDIKAENSMKICRINRASHGHFLEDKDNWSHINISAQYLRKVLRSAVEACEDKQAGENTSMTQTQAKLNDYCANVAPFVQECAGKKKQGNCAGGWVARVLESGWCCIDRNHPSKNCCCPIPQ